jgi:exosortase/archaeosortase family protein
VTLTIPADSKLSSTLRGVLAFGALAGGIALFVVPHAVQRLEAQTTADLLRSLLGYHADGSSSGEPAIQFGASSLSNAVRVTTECSSAPILGLILIITAALLTGRVHEVGRVLLAVLASAGLFFVLNLARLMTICWAFSRYGQTGFRVTHIYLGSIISLVGLIACLVVYLAVAGMWHNARRGPGPDRGAKGPGPIAAATALVYRARHARPPARPRA